MCRPLTKEKRYEHTPKDNPPSHNPKENCAGRVTLMAHGKKWCPEQIG